MKKVIISVSATLLLMFSIAPYFIGRLQMNAAEAVIQNFGNDDSDSCNQFATDAEIEDVLRVFNFNLDALATPTFSDYYNAGLITIQSL